jgi:hypothetical protein
MNAQDCRLRTLPAAVSARPTFFCGPQVRCILMASRGAQMEIADE